MTSSTNPSSSYFPLAGATSDGFSTPSSATATCYCGAVQLAFPLHPPGLLGSFTCHCYDCRKITASMFASNFSVADTHLSHLRGEQNLTSYAQSKTIASGHVMTNFFCKTCGTLMYRVGEQFPGRKIMRIGTVDDFRLHETVLRPKREIFVADRVSWVAEVEGAVQVEKQRPKM